MAALHANRFDILVVGAGYTGLATARALSVRLGGHLSIGLLDRHPFDVPPKPDPRASALSAGAVNLLQSLNVWPRLSPDAQPVDHIDITDPVGDSPLRQVMLSYENKVDGCAASWIVENDDLKAALLDTVREDSNITLCPPGSVADVDADAAVATVGLEDQTRVTAQLIVAADGGQSRLRELAGIKVTGWPYRQTGIVTTVRHDRPHNATAVQHFLPAGPFAILPLKGNRSSIVWSEEETVAAEVMECDDEVFLSALQGRFGTRLGTLALDGPRAAWPLKLKLARELTAPRLALVGEAARTVHPIAGQGFNLAVRDIAALADTVADNSIIGIDPGNAETLAQYAQWRRFDGGTSALAFDAINRLFSNGNPLLRSFRDTGLELVNRSETLKSFFVREAAGLTGDAVPSLMRPVPSDDGTSMTKERAEAEI